MQDKKPQKPDEIIELAKMSGRYMIALTYVDKGQTLQHTLIQKGFPANEMVKAHIETGKLVKEQASKAIGLDKITE